MRSTSASDVASVSIGAVDGTYSSHLFALYTAVWIDYPQLCTLSHSHLVEETGNVEDRAQTASDSRIPSAVLPSRTTPFRFIPRM